MTAFDRTVLTGDGWQAEFSPQSSMAMQFQFADCRLQLMPLELGNISESHGLVKKLQPHRSVDGLRQSLNLELVIPFGAEPRLRRDIAFAANHATVSSYIELKGNLALSQLNIDPLFLPGVWSRVGIIEIPEPGEDIQPPVWYPVKQVAEQEIYRSSRPFLVCLLENEQGEIIEIGTGDDLWRWQAAKAMPELAAEFSITARSEGISITRKVFCATSPVKMENRPWRFKWYFAWGKIPTVLPIPEVEPQSFAFNAKFSKVADRSAVFDFTTAKLTSTAAVIDADGDTKPCLCFKAGAVNKALRRFIRSAAQHCRDDELIFTGLEPHCCASAAHLERPKKAFLVHWDMISIIDFYDWANRQLVKNGRCLRLFIDADSALCQLPSLVGMGCKTELPPEDEI